MWLLKDYGKHDIAQALGAIQLVFAQTSVVYNVWYCKTRLNDWSDNQWNQIRIWLFIECIWFFSWIQTGILYLFFAYFSKMVPVTKDFKNKEEDDNPWNEKYSDDFMRYVKAEMYSTCHLATKLAFDFMLGFSSVYEIDKIGPRDGYPTLTIFALLIIDRTYTLFHYLVAQYKGMQNTSTEF